MASEISNKGGVAEMAYVGAKPWHGLGNTLQAGASIEEWKAAAGMEWTVESAPALYDVSPSPSREQILVVPEKKVLFRSDNGDALGVVGDGFKIVQPGEVLEFFRDLTAKAGFQLETAGVLFGGKRFWALARTGEQCEVVPGDIVRGYLLLCTGADGSLSTTGKYVMERVVCNNTLGVALREGGHQHKISHRSKFSAEQMKKALRINMAHDAFRDLERTAGILADKTCSTLRAQSLALALLAGDAVKREPDEKEKIAIMDKTESSTGYKTIMRLFEGEGRGATLDGVKDTAWGFLNAVTQYCDHETRAKSADHRLSRVIEGDADAMKAEALRLCLAY